MADIYGEDRIDSRDVLERIDELERFYCGHRWEEILGDALREHLVEEHSIPAEEVAALEGAPLSLRHNDEHYAVSEDEENELEELRALIEEIEGYAGDSARCGIFLISESSFEAYAMELAEDLGAIDREAAWPACHIDWEAAADSLKMDYTSVTFDGREYWYR